MARPQRLEAETIEAALREIDAWQVKGGRLHREFVFADFKAAFDFMTRVSVVAEELDHHPDWSNVYNRVRVDLYTHDVGGLTELDLKLARTMNRIAG